MNRARWMSKYMQIDVRLIPFYEKSFKKAFPKIAELLKEMDYAAPLEKDISLYDLVDYLEDMTHTPHISRDLKGKLSQVLNRLVPLKEVARERLLSRRLNELDRSLYQMEDLFEELERSL
jgi:hypothetical protein